MYLFIAFGRKSGCGNSNQYVAFFGSILNRKKIKEKKERRDETQFTTKILLGGGEKFF